MFSIDLTGQSAIVTGASSGIGRATAIALATAGANIAIHYRQDRAAAEETAQQVTKLGRKATIAAGDFRYSEQVTSAIDSCARALGGSVDILINNAGSSAKSASIEDTDAALWNEVMELNLNSVFHCVRAALPYLRDGARVVNVSTTGARHGGSGKGLPYIAAKGGIISLTRGLAKALAPRGIRVNAIAPGIIRTPSQDRLTPPGMSTAERLEQVRQTIPIGRIGEADDCAQAILFLCAPMSSYLLGEVIEVNGGQYFT